MSASVSGGVSSRSSYVLGENRFSDGEDSTDFEGAVELASTTLTDDVYVERTPDPDCSHTASNCFAAASLSWQQSTNWICGSIK